MGNVARLDGIDRFVGFLDHVMSNGRVRLLAIPWAAIRRAKRRYRSYELIERGVLFGMRCPLKRVLMLRCRHAILLLSSYLYWKVYPSTQRSRQTSETESSFTR